MNIDKFFRAAILIGAMFSGLTQSAQASIYTYTGNTTGGATYHRLVDDLSELSTIGTNVMYQAQSFTVGDTGIYTFLMTSNYDGMLFLYQNSFDPTSPSQNGLVGNDDLIGTTTSGFNGLLQTNTTYTLVATAYGNDVAGAYSITIGGPGVITAVPEPSTWLMLGLGLAVVGYARRRNSQR